MKKLARKQTSSRKTSSVSQVITKRKRGGEKTKHRKVGSTTYTVTGYAGNKCLTMVGKTTLREDRLWGANAPHHRRVEQLSTLGKLQANPKVKQDPGGLTARWGDLISAGVEFTVLGLLEAMCRGKIKPLYTLEGKCLAPL